MKTLKNKISEYFLGTESIREFKIARNFYREYAENSNDLFYKYLKKEDKIYFCIGKIVPNIITSFSLYYLIEDKNQFAALGILIGEFLRFNFSDHLKDLTQRMIEIHTPKLKRLSDLNGVSFSLENDDEDE